MTTAEALLWWLSLRAPLASGLSLACPGIDLAVGLAGHYVVISGYNAADDLFSVCDPALAIGHIKIPSAMLELARSAFGTDEDLLIIPRPLHIKQIGGKEDNSTVCTQANRQQPSVSGSPNAALSALDGTVGSAALC